VEPLLGAPFVKFGIASKALIVAGTAIIITAGISRLHHFTADALLWITDTDLAWILGHLHMRSATTGALSRAKLSRCTDIKIITAHAYIRDLLAGSIDRTNAGGARVVIFTIVRARTGRA
tara:strand:+ start:406 stop:765 length:360 start_codon:yes stop_codon:yes gene_type:complete